MNRNSIRKALRALRHPFGIVLAGCVCSVFAIEPASDVAAPITAAPAGPLLLSETVPKDGTGIVTGKVIDLSGRSVVGASVTAIEASRTTTTDERGGFVLPGIPLGTATVRAGKPGYEDQTIAGIRVSKDAATRILFHLESRAPGHADTARSHEAAFRASVPA